MNDNSYVTGNLALETEVSKTLSKQWIHPWDTDFSGLYMCLYIYLTTKKKGLLRHPYPLKTFDNAEK